MKELTFVEKFADQITEAVTTKLTGYEGKDEFGNHIINYEELDASGNVVSTGKARYFRDNALADIKVDEDGVLLEPYTVSRNGLWITPRGVAFDNTGYGRVPKK
jgi:hypothetical protein